MDAISPNRPGPNDFDAFTPKDIPGQLWELEPALLANLFDAAWAYGFPHSLGEGEIRTVLLPGAIHLTASYPGRPLLYIDGTAKDPYLLFLPAGGLTVWQRALSVRQVAQALRELDERMAARGLKQPGTGKRIELLSSAEKFRVDEVFVPKGTCYHLNPEWDEVALMQRFDRPQELAAPLTATRRRALCLKSAVASVLEIEGWGAKYRKQIRAAEDRFRTALLAQRDPRRYS